jgi:hypothetical protein
LSLRAWRSVQPINSDIFFAVIIKTGFHDLALNAPREPGNLPGDRPPGGEPFFSWR